MVGGMLKGPFALGFNVFIILIISLDFIRLKKKEFNEESFNVRLKLLPWLFLMLLRIFPAIVVKCLFSSSETFSGSAEIDPSMLREIVSLFLVLLILISSFTPFQIFLLLLILSLK